MQPKTIRNRPIALKFVRALATALVLAAGCRGPATPTAPTPGKPLEGVSIRIASPGKTAALLERYGRDWAAEAGAALRIVPIDPAGTLPAEADLWVIAPAQLGHWAGAGRLLPVPEKYTSLSPDSRYGWQDLLPIYRSRLLVWGRQPYALPILGDARLCFFRQDLFRDPANQAAFQKKFGRPLEPPQTWEDFADIAGYFQQDAGRPFSLPPLPASADELDREFFSVASPFVVRPFSEGTRQLPPAAELYSFSRDFANGQPRLTSPGFVYALRLMQRLQRNRPATPAVEPPTVFRDGQSVLCLASPSWIGRFSEAGSPIQGKFGFCPVPGSRKVFSFAGGEAKELNELNSVAYLGAGGWLGVVPKSSAQPAAAFDLLAELSGRKTSRQIFTEPRWGGGPLRRSHFDKVEDWYAFGLDAAWTTTLRKAVQIFVDPLPINPAVRLRLADEQEQRDALVEELRAALSGKKEAEKALDDAAGRWRGIDARKGAEARRAEFRTSLGR